MSSPNTNTIFLFVVFGLSWPRLEGKRKSHTCFKRRPIFISAGGGGGGGYRRVMCFALIRIKPICAMFAVVREALDFCVSVKYNFYGVGIDINTLDARYSALFLDV